MARILESVVCLWLMPENSLRMPWPRENEQIMNVQERWYWTINHFLDFNPFFFATMKLLHPMASVQDCFHDDFCDDDVIHDAQHGPLWVWEPQLSGKNRDGFIQWSSNATHFENKSNNYIPNCRRNRNWGVISMIQNAFVSMVMLLFALVIPHKNARSVDW